MIITDIQIRFADTDILGHVNNVNLQHFFDQGKMDYFQKVVGLSLVWKKEGFVQVHTSCDYFEQVFLDEPISVRSGIESLGNKSLRFVQQIYNRETGQIKAASESVNVAFDFELQQSIPLLPEWRSAIESHGLDTLNSSRGDRD